MFAARVVALCTVDQDLSYFQRVRQGCHVKGGFSSDILGVLVCSVVNEVLGNLQRVFIG